jgi:hypothetical protein
MEPMPEGTRAIVDQAVDEAAQTLFSAADVPIARADELLKALQGPAVRAVLEARVEQIIKHGHTAEGDWMLPLGMLGKESRDRLAMAGDCLYGDRRDLKIARRRAVVGVALGLAFIDRLDAEVAHEAAAAPKPSGEGAGE